MPAARRPLSAWSRWLGSSLGLILLAGLLWLQTSEHGNIADIRERLDNIAYDVRLTYTLPDNRDWQTPVRILDIDERSLQAIGHWPWPRDVLAQLTDKLFEQGVLVVGFDMVFAEAERNSVAEVIEYGRQSEQLNEPQIQVLQQVVPAFNHDRQLSNSFQERDVVLGFVLHNRANTRIGTLPQPLSIRNSEPGILSSITVADSYTANLAVLHEHTPFGGFFTTVPDRDGVIRQTPLVLRHQQDAYASLALEMARLFLLLDEVTIDARNIGDRPVMEHLVLGQQRIPTDARGNILIPYRGARQTFPYISAVDVLQGRLPANSLQNKLVIIGTSAEGLYDMRTTPLEANVAGVEIHATILDALLNGQFPFAPAWATGANFVQVLLIGLLLIVLLPRVSAIYMIIISAVLFGAVLGVNFWLWQQQGLVLALATPLLTIFILTSYYLARGYLGESRSRRALSNIFGQYVPPQLVKEMNRDPDHYSTHGETREMTVLFSDIVGFTSLSEQIGAGELKELLNRFFTPMTQIIFNHHGTIDKYVGDMIMAFWNAPVDDPEHAQHALDTAMTMLVRLDMLNRELQHDGLPPIHIGIGLNTGQMNVGDMGSEFRRAYTVIGDAVNLGARLEGLTRYYGVDIVVSEYTQAQCEGYVFQELDRVRVKGKAEPVTVYAPRCRVEAADPALISELEQHQRGLQFYRDQQWQSARDVFSTLGQQHPQRALYSLYLERIDQLSTLPLPDDWDGVYDRRTK